MPLPPLPTWVLEVLRARRAELTSSGIKTKSPKVRDQIGVAEGGRHDALFGYVSSLRGANVAFDDAVDRADARNATYVPALKAVEVTAIVDDVYQRYQPNPTKYEPGDFGNAAYLAAHLAGQVLYDWNERRWLVWNGNIWMPDTDGAMTRMWEREAHTRILDAARLAASDPEAAKPESKAGYAMLATKNRMSQALEIAAANDKLKDDGLRFDANPYLFGFPNGIYNLRTKEFRPGRPEDRVTKVVSYNYDPSATCPKMDKALEEIFCGDRELIDAFWVHVGYMATGDVSERVIIFAYGEGANGKNLVFRLVRFAFGPYAMTANASLLQQFDSRQKRISNETRDLKGTRLALIDEWPASTPADPETFKKLLGGGEEIRARNLHEKDVEFVPTHHLVVRCNERPIIKDESEASWDRIILWPFNARFDNDDPAARPRNVHLYEEIARDEVPGIFNRIAKGAALWVPGHLPRPSAVRAATLDYRAEQDPVLAWMRDPAFVVLDPNARTPFAALYENFKRHWHSQPGNFMKDPMSSVKFGKQLKLPTRRLKVAPGGTRAYEGIAVVVPALAAIVRDDDADDVPPTDEEAAALVAMFN